MKVSTFSKNILMLVLLLSTIGTTIDAAIPFKKKEFSKKIEKTFDISADGKVDLNNRYGQVTVKTWDQNRVEVEVVIKVNARDEESAEETFDRIDIEFSNTTDYVSVETNIESNSSGSSWLSWLGGSSSNDDYSIHYLVNMPASNNLKLANKYGNSAVEDIKGEADLIIKYGNIDMGDVGGDLTFDLGYGNATIGNTGNADVTIKYSNLKMKNAKDVRIESKYSKVRIAEAAELRSQSKYDNYDLGRIIKLRNNGKYDHFDIEYLQELDIETKYTDVDIDHLENKGFVLMSHGGLSVDELSPNFDKLQLEGRYTDFKIETSGNFQLDAQASYGNIRYPDGMEISINKEESNDHEVKGYLGNKDSGLIKARLDYGNLKLY